MLATSSCTAGRPAPCLSRRCNIPRGLVVGKIRDDRDKTVVRHLITAGILKGKWATPERLAPLVSLRAVRSGGAKIRVTGLNGSSTPDTLIDQEGKFSIPFVFHELPDPHDIRLELIAWTNSKGIGRADGVPGYLVDVDASEFPQVGDVPRLRGSSVRIFEAAWHFKHHQTPLWDRLGTTETTMLVATHTMRVAPGGVSS